MNKQILSKYGQSLKLPRSALSKKYYLYIAAITLIYIITGHLGLLFAIPETIVTPIWFPSGIALAAGLILGYQVWPAIFLGSFFNNTLWELSHLVENSDFSEIYLIINFLVAGGAALQMLAGVYLIKRFIPTINPFSTAKNALIFFVCAMVSCLINSLIGVTTIVFADVIKSDDYLSHWWTWWLGDTTGVILGTTLILSGFIVEDYPKTHRKILEAICLLILTIIASFFSFSVPYSIQFIITPLLLWGAFRFNLIGTTLTIFITSIIAMWYTVHDQGPFALAPINPLLILQMFVAIVSMAIIEVSATITERRIAEKSLEESNQNLEEKVDTRTQELQLKNDLLNKMLVQAKEMQTEIITQAKLASLGSLTLGITREIGEPIVIINNFLDHSLKLMEQLEGICKKQQEYFDEHLMLVAAENLKSLSANLTTVNEYAKKAQNIVKIMQHHTRENAVTFETTDINSLVKEAINVTYQEQRQKDFSLSIKLDQDLDSSIEPLMTISGDIYRSLLCILNNAIFELVKKKKRLGASFQPILTVRTRNLDNQVMILIRDNGDGIPKEIQDKIFTPFFTTKQPGEGIGLGLSISRDIIIITHGGNLTVLSDPGQFAEFTIFLPKSSQLHLHGE